MSTETNFDIPLVISVIALGLTVAVSIKEVVNLRDSRQKLRDDALEVLKELDHIINDANIHEDEGVYETDLSLKSYFQRNQVKIQTLANGLQERQTPLYPKDKTLPQLGELFEWMLRDFYCIHREEEERIRVWSQNIPDYYKRRNAIIVK